MRLLALSDLHVHHRGNRDAVEAIPAHPEDALIVAGDVSERPDAVHDVLASLRRRFAFVMYVPGNHELWTMAGQPRGVAKYDAIVDAARAAGAWTPEDGWWRWPGDGPPTAVVPLCLLYDHGFAPEGVDPIAWAAEDGIHATDTRLLHPDPYPSIAAWCHARVAAAERLLATIPATLQTVLVNHWPLRGDLVRLPLVPRYRPWCGTPLTADWPWRYRARVCVAGHLHVRTTDVLDGVRFEEVSLGYPRQWRHPKTASHYLREILPGPPASAARLTVVHP